MHHPFMDSLAEQLAACSVASLRYQFPYTQHRKKSPDVPAVLTATVRAAITAALAAAPDLPLLAGGKSLGGRMTSMALSEKPSAAETAMAGVRGLVFFGFPLHAPGRPSSQRADHLVRVQMPMLFFQGTRDTLADLTLMRTLRQKLGSRATLHVMDTADHSFHVLKRSGKTDTDVLSELACAVVSWADSLP
nr:alpha/beta family hydrolase [Nitrospira sp. KM1]